MSERPDAMYEALARWQLRRRRGLPPGEGLELRKRLAPPVPGARGPADGGAGLDAWLRELAGERARGRVLDLGCGFGASLLRWLATGAQSGVGVTASAVQVATARQETERRGLAARASFVHGDFTALPPGPFDVVLAIESLGHAHDLAAVLQRVRAALAPDGVLLLVDDHLRETRNGDDADVRELARRWRSPRLRSVAELDEAMISAGFITLAEHDLTEQVHASDEQVLTSRRRWLQLARLLPMPSSRLVVDAFLGGIALERLHRRRLACYRARVATPADQRP